MLWYQNHAYMIDLGYQRVHWGDWVPMMASLVDLIAAGMVFATEAETPCGCCGLCLQGMAMCVLWHVGVMVIVHSCMHKENLNRLHFLLIPFCQMVFHFCQISLLLSTRKGTQAALRGKRWKVCALGRDNELYWTVPQYQEIGKDLSEVHDSCPGQQKTRKTQLWLFWNSGRLCLCGLTDTFCLQVTCGMCTILHLENIKAKAELSPAAQASASLRSCSILPPYANLCQHWYLIWKPFLLQLTWQGHLLCTIQSPPHNNFQCSLPIFQEMSNPITKLTNSLFPAACPARLTSLPTSMCLIPPAPLWAALPGEGKDPCTKAIRRCLWKRVQCSSNFECRKIR